MSSKPKPWVTVAGRLGPLHGAGAPVNVRSGARDLGILFLSTLPGVVVVWVATLEVLDVFKLRRILASLFVFGLEWAWDLGVMLSGPLALAAWTLLLGLLMVPAAALLLASTAHDRRDGRELVRNAILLMLAVLGGGMVMSLSFLVSFTALMIFFALVWLVPAGMLAMIAVTLLRRARSGGEGIFLGTAAAALHVCWMILAFQILSANALVSERVVSLPEGVEEVAFLRFDKDSSVLEVGEHGRARSRFLQLGTGSFLESPPPAAVFDQGGFAGDQRFVLTDGMEIGLVDEAIEFKGLSGTMIVQGHRPMKTRAIALSPDGGRLASCGTDNVVRLWSPATGEHLKTLWGHSDDVEAIAFSQDGQWLASASVDGTVRLWRHFR